MSRDPDHGGQGWSFSTCVWAPTEKKLGGGWPFWSKVEQIKQGDLILHLRGVHPDAAFVGFSTAATDGYKTSEKPTILGQWSFAKDFFRADLEDYNPFPSPISLSSIFRSRDEELRHYFKTNEHLPRSAKKNIFYVIQSGRLQCLNGAYLSDLENELAEIILGSDFTGEELTRPSDISVATGQRIQKIRARIGQSYFSECVKANYKSKCCFPQCKIDDPTFLVGSHIARWADRIDLRGDLSNGICLCLMHDKAFEDGYFSLDSMLRIISLGKHSDSSVYTSAIEPYCGQKIATSSILPSSEAIEEHLRRHNYQPSRTAT